MKVIFKLALVLLVFSFYACSSDDDVNIVNNASLGGVWTLSSLSVESSFDFNIDGTASRNLVVETPCYDGDFLNFREDGTVNIVSSLTYISVEITSPTEYGHIYECLDGFDIESTWTIEGSTATVENGGTDLVGVISGNTLTVLVEDTFEIEMYDGIEYTYPEEDIVLVYTKQ